jgi:hypothetical protein
MVRGFGMLLVLIAALAAAHAKGDSKAKAQEDVLHVTYYFMPG